MPAGMAAAAAGAQGCGAPGRRALYFCGSIRGGREDQALYERIVSRLRRFGTVLTEHVADPELGAQGEGRGRGRRDGGGSAAPLYRNCPGGGRGPLATPPRERGAPASAPPRGKGAALRPRASARSRGARPAAALSCCPGLELLLGALSPALSGEVGAGAGAGGGRVGADGAAWVPTSRW